MGRLETTTDEIAGLTTRYTYNEVGLVEDVFTRWWDGSLVIDGQVDPGGWVEVPQSHTEYDDEGRVVKTYDAGSNPVDRDAEVVAA